MELVRAHSSCTIYDSVSEKSYKWRVPDITPRSTTLSGQFICVVNSDRNLWKHFEVAELGPMRMCFLGCGYLRLFPYNPRNRTYLYC